MPKDYQLISDAASLREAVDAMSSFSELAIDTEFVWERTYFARLGLVQFGLPGKGCYLVDAVQISDLGSLGSILENESIVKILHDAPQDLMILHRATGATTRNVFDTRLAAGFAGMSSELSLQRLLFELLDVEIPKGHTRADWTSRPLEAHLLEYAVDDVRYLPELAFRLREGARESGIEHWLNEELSALERSSACRQPVPERQYLRVKGVGGLSEEGLSVLRELAAWREHEAINTDRPRRQIAEDRDLIAVAHALPADEVELKACNRISKGVLRRYSGVLLSAVKQGRGSPKAELPLTPLRTDIRKVGRERVDGLFHRIGKRARERRIDPLLVTNKNGVVRLLSEWPDAQPEDHRLMQGWRSELLGDSLESLIQV